MCGKVKIINTSEDKINSEFSDEQIIEMATITVRYDDVVYPDSYNTNLKREMMGGLKKCGDLKKR